MIHWTQGLKKKTCNVSKSPPYRDTTGQPPRAPRNLHLADFICHMLAVFPHSFGMIGLNIPLKRGLGENVVRAKAAIHMQLWLLSLARGNN